MKVLLLGSGGREHALYWKLKGQDAQHRVLVTPGNGGIDPADIATNAPDVSDQKAMVRFVRESGFDLVVIGPEQPLVDGLADALQGICPVFGPGQKAARLEGSKSFAKDFMRRHNIPTAQAERFDGLEPALDYLKSRSLPIVIKADGLAAGKGVTVATTLDQAQTAVRECLEQNRFGDAGRTVLIEDFLQGVEASVFALCDGKRALPFLPAQDHKRAFDNDQGPNTGGMGAFAPTATVTPAIMEQVQAEVLDRTVAGMAKDGTPYHGLLYAGLMVHNGKASVVEFNVRFGDPETQALMRLLDEDLADLCLQSARGELPDRKLRFREGAAVVVVVAAEGYPGDYKKGHALKNVDSFSGDIICFHAGTQRVGGQLTSTGGRILCMTATGEEPAQAARAAYRALEKIEAPGTFYRTDIGTNTRSA